MANSTRGHTTQMILEAGEYFIAHLDNGGIRLGMLNFTCFDFPMGSKRHGESLNLTAEDVESYYDECFGAYMMVPA